VRERADLGLFPNAKFSKNRLSGWALRGKLITKIANFNGFEFLGYGFLLVFNSNYRRMTHRQLQLTNVTNQ